MDSQQAKTLIEEHKSVISESIRMHCGKEAHRASLALLYIHQRLSDQDWQLVRKYDDSKSFNEFFQELLDDILKTFSYGVWFGECARTIQYWIAHYGIKNDVKQQDAEDYVKNHLAKDNFARFRSYDKSKSAHFTTYISKVIRNLIIDYLRKKTPVVETAIAEKTCTEDGSYYIKRNLDSIARESELQLHLKEISQWFFAASMSKEIDETQPKLPNIPDKLKLTHKERLFLRAIYKEGMTAQEAGRMPGFNMGKWQSYNFHRRLKSRVKKLLRAMGYESLNSLLYA